SKLSNVPTFETIETQNFKTNQSLWKQSAIRMPAIKQRPELHATTRVRLARIFRFRRWICRRAPTGLLQQAHRISHRHRKVRSSVLSENRERDSNDSARWSE